MTRRGAGPAPWGLFGMLALVALSEWAFARVELDVLLPEHWDWRTVGRAARTEAVRADVLCFGDSLLKFAALPTVVETRAGRSAYNLAVPRGQAASSYFLLRRALRAGARPSAVLVEAAPHLLRLSPRSEAMRRLWPELLTPAEVLDLTRATRDPDLFVRVALARLLPTLRARHEVRGAVRTALRGEVSPRRFQAAQFLRNTRVNRGANAMEAKRPDTPGMDRAVRLLFEEGFGCDPVNFAYLNRFLSLAAVRGIPAFLVLTPFSTETAPVAARSGLDAAQTAFARSLLARHPGLTVLDGRRSGYGPHLYCSDPLHLNHLGAAAFSDDLATLLSRALTADGASPCWVFLPPYRPRPQPVPVEDLAASAFAIVNRRQASR